jgi:hypothetical protein
MKTTPTFVLLVVLSLCLLVSLARGAAPVDAAPSCDAPERTAVPSEPPAPAPEEEFVILCGGSFYISPDRDWTMTLFGNPVGLQQWYDSTTIVLGDFQQSVPVRAPILAGGIGTALALLFVGAAVTLRSRSGAGAEAS